MLKPSHFHRIYRISAWYDLIITWPFAFVPTLMVVMTLVGFANERLGLPPIPTLPPTGVMFGNFFGSVVVIWSIVRLRWDDAALARYDAAGRWLFSLAMCVALLKGASPLLFAFLVPEVLFAILQSLPVRKNRRVGA